MDAERLWGCGDDDGFVVKGGGGGVFVQVGMYVCM